MSERSPNPPSSPPPAHAVCDVATEGLLYFVVVFSPWAFGTTEPWSVWTLNVASYALGTLLILKWAIRRTLGHAPARWGDGQVRRPWTRLLTPALGSLTLFLLAYVLVSALNARAVYHFAESRFDYRESFIPCLPHSYDAARTWQAFWNYLAIACVFWSVRDWLLIRDAAPYEPGSLPSEGRAGLSSAPADARHSGFNLPPRLRRLLWVLCVNGALIALVGILQRLGGTSKLLWLREPHWIKTAEAQFGPFAYRSNGAQYLNMVWPVSLAFWHLLRGPASRRHPRSARAGSSPRALLLPCAALALAGPIVSTSRGGALVAAGQLVLALPLLLGRKRTNWYVAAGSGVVLTLAVALGLALGWSSLGPRLETILTEGMSGRAETVVVAGRMQEDFGWLGSGPGTMPALYQLYRSSEAQEWAAYLHNDWLETRITFGRIGFAAVLLGFVAILFLSGYGRGISCPPEDLALLWVALGGCLAHACFDFPFQIYSLLLLFVLLCAVASACSAESR